jgi:hypothetical protein
MENSAENIFERERCAERVAEEYAEKIADCTAE